MSVEAHPNLHAVQFTVEIIEALERAKRNEGAKMGFAVNNDIRDLIISFVADVSTAMDVAVETNLP